MKLAVSFVTIAALANPWFVESSYSSSYYKSKSSKKSKADCCGSTLVGSDLENGPIVTTLDTFTRVGKTTTNKGDDVGKRRFELWTNNNNDYARRECITAEGEIDRECRVTICPDNGENGCLFGTSIEKEVDIDADPYPDAEPLLYIAITGGTNEYAGAIGQAVAESTRCDVSKPEIGQDCNGVADDKDKLFKSTITLMYYKLDMMSMSAMTLD